MARGDIVWKYRPPVRKGYRVMPGSRKLELCPIYPWLWLAKLVGVFYAVQRYEVSIQEVTY